MTELPLMLKKEHETAENVISVLKRLILRTERQEITDITLVYIEEQSEISNTRPRTHCDHLPIVFHNVSGYNPHLFIKELGK